MVGGWVGGSSEHKFSTIIIYHAFFIHSQCLSCGIGWACPLYWIFRLVHQSFWALLPTLFNSDFAHSSSEWLATLSKCSYNPGQVLKLNLFVCRMQMRGSIRNYRFCKRDRGCSTLTARTSYVPNSQWQWLSYWFATQYVHWRGCLKIDCAVVVDLE